VNFTPPQKLHPTRNFILQNDPIPRALLSVDPTYQLFAGLPVVQSLLELRAWLAGSSGAPLSPTRFLFETVGEVHFIKWSAQGECGGFERRVCVLGCRGACLRFVAVVRWVAGLQGCRLCAQVPNQPTNQQTNKPINNVQRAPRCCA